MRHVGLLGRESAQPRTRGFARGGPGGSMSSRLRTLLLGGAAAIALTPLSAAHAQDAAPTSAPDSSRPSSTGGAMRSGVPGILSITISPAAASLKPRATSGFCKARNGELSRNHEGLRER